MRSSRTLRLITITIIFAGLAAVVVESAAGYTPVAEPAVIALR